MKLDDIKKLQQKKYRSEFGHFLVEGEHLLLELQKAAVHSPALLDSQLYVTAAHEHWQSPFRTQLISDRQMAQIADTQTPQGILAVVPMAALTPPASATSERAIYLHEIQDPGNLGTILRTAAAAGVPEVLLTPGCAQAWAPRVLRAAMGAHFGLAIREGVDVAAALAGYPGQILAADLRDSVELYDLDLRGPVAWLFGSEGQGLSAAVAGLATGRVLIPMPGGMESLNVGVAAGVCLFEQLRQRRASGR